VGVFALGFAPGGGPGFRKRNVLHGGRFGATGGGDKRLQFSDRKAGARGGGESMLSRPLGKGTFTAGQRKGETVNSSRTTAVKEERQGGERPPRLWGRNKHPRKKRG